MATLLNFRNDSRRLLNLVNDTEQITDTELTEWANKCLRNLIAWLELDLSTDTQTTVSGTKEYTISTDFLKITDVYYNNKKLWQVDEDWLSARDRSWQDDNNNVPDYFFMSARNKIKLHPTPNEAKTLDIRIIPVPTSLSDPDDSPSTLPTIYHDCFQWFMTSMAKYKLNDPINGDRYFQRYLQLRVDLRSGGGQVSEERSQFYWT